MLVVSGPSELCFAVSLIKVKCQNIGRCDLLSVHNTLQSQYVHVSTYQVWCLKALLSIFDQGQNVSCSDVLSVPVHSTRQSQYVSTYQRSEGIIVNKITLRTSFLFDQCQK